MSSTRTIHALAAFESKGEIKPWSYESRPLGPEDIEIEITHCGICGSDIHTIDSGWGPTTYPVVPGHEIVGKVTEVGPSVDKFKVGDRVGVGAQVWACLNKDASKPCHECEVGMDALCSSIVATYNGKYRDGSTSYGGYADFIRVIQDYAFTIPKIYPAPLLCAGATVYTPLKHEGVKSGDRVGVIGIGGLGHLAIQFIAAIGAIPVAFSRSNSKEKEVRALGAQDFIATNDMEQVKSASRSLDYLLITADANGMPYDQYLGFLRPRDGPFTDKEIMSYALRSCLRSTSSTSAVDLNFNVKSQREMEQLGACIGRRLRLNDVMLLYGDLGCGKTCLARGSIRELTNSDILVPSPSYLLVNSYVTAKSVLYHVDLYRLRQVTFADAKALGLVNAFGSGIVIVEWPDRIFEHTQKICNQEETPRQQHSWVPNEYLQVTIKYDTQDGTDWRNVAFRPVGKSWEDRLIDFSITDKNK
ncbi:hypothetical protein ABG067_000730 [Albugo candida]